MSLRLGPRATARPPHATRRERRVRAAAAPPAARADGAEVARHRRAGGPDDSALYACACGTSFRADVTASVRCPRCGAAQAW